MSAAPAIGIGIAVGLVASLSLTRTIANALWCVTATDPATNAVVAVTLLVVACAACFVPVAVRARSGPAGGDTTGIEARGTASLSTLVTVRMMNSLRWYSGACNVTARRQSSVACRAL
jgi:hypothetical protein